MDERMFEEEYRRWKKQSAPDIWDRIEPNLKEHKKAVKRRKRFYPYGAAAAAAAVILIAAGPYFGKVGKNGGMEMTGAAAGEAGNFSGGTGDYAMAEGEAAPEAEAAIPETAVVTQETAAGLTETAAGIQETAAGLPETAAGIPEAETDISGAEGYGKYVGVYRLENNEETSNEGEVQKGVEVEIAEIQGNRLWGKVAVGPGQEAPEAEGAVEGVEITEGKARVTMVVKGTEGKEKPETYGLIIYFTEKGGHVGLIVEAPANGDGTSWRKELERTK